jgi:hypothetical protein
MTATSPGKVMVVSSVPVAVRVLLVVSSAVVVLVVTLSGQHESLYQGIRHAIPGGSGRSDSNGVGRNADIGTAKGGRDGCSLSGTEGAKRIVGITDSSLSQDGRSRGPAGRANSYPKSKDGRKKGRHQVRLC